MNGFKYASILTLVLCGLLSAGKSYAVEFHECEKFVGKDEVKHTQCLQYSFREAVTKADYPKISAWLSAQPREINSNDFLTLLMCDSHINKDGEMLSSEGDKPFRKEDSAAIIRVTDQLLDLGVSFESMATFALVTPLYCLTNRQNSVVLDHVLTRINANERMLDGSHYEGVIAMYVPLYRAALNNDIASAEVLLKHGATVNFLADSIHTALFAALEKHHVEFAHWLLDRGASVNIRDPKYACSDKTALEYAMAIPESVGGRDALVERMRKLTTIPLTTDAVCTDKN